MALACHRSSEISSVFGRERELLDLEQHLALVRRLEFGPDQAGDAQVRLSDLEPASVADVGCVPHDGHDKSILNLMSTSR
jgi:hypothetical protein